MALAAVPDEPEEVVPTVPDPSLPPVDVPLLVVHPGGPLKGRTLLMHLPSVRWWIANERGLTDAVGFWEEVVTAIEQHDLGRDVETLPPAYITLISNAWVKALTELALPPASGDD